MEVVQCSGISCTKAKYTTFLAYLKKLGYGFRQTRRKGILTDRDYKKRLGHARKMQKMKSDFWMRDVAFYLDGVSFIYKRNPLGEALKPKKVWHKKCEGLSITTKGVKTPSWRQKITSFSCNSIWKRCYFCRRIQKDDRKLFFSLHYEDFPKTYLPDFKIKK